MLKRSVVIGAALLFASTAHAALNISTQATQNVSCSDGVCTATAQQAWLNVKRLTNMLASGDVKLVTANGAQDIHVQAPFSWTGTSRLTLNSQRSIRFEQPVTVAGTGALTLITNDGETGGDYWFDQGASVTFWDTSSSLIINGATFALVKDIKTLASAVIKNSKGNYALANSYDASADGVYKHAVVTATLAGEFEGLGNAISNLRIRKDNLAKSLNVGLFAQLGSGGAIRNVVLTNPFITADADNENVGALVAYSQGGLIAHSTINGGSVNGGYYAQSDVVGGLVGRSDASSVVISSGSAAYASGGYAARVGGLVGFNSGTVSDSFATGSAAAQIEAYTGGLVGLSDGSIDSSFATGDISAGENFEGGPSWGGGLVGKGYATNSHATGQVQGGDDSFVGGLVGEGGASNCYATGAVFGGFPSTLGGLVAMADASVISSFATGNVQGEDSAQAGGLVGYETSAGSIENSYASGSITAGDNAIVGGLVGYKDRSAPIEQSYSLGAPKAGDTHQTFIGGVVGYDAATHHPKNFIRATYWDLDTSGISDPAQGAGNVPNDSGITGLTDAQLKSELPAGFDPKVWHEKGTINNGYPYLLANRPPKNGPGKLNVPKKLKGRSR